MRIPPSLRLHRFIVPAIVVLGLIATPLNVSAGTFSLTLMESGFSAPLLVTNAGDSRLFVVEKGGLIKIIGGGTFLDWSTKVKTDGERGLVSLAFDPDYATNGLFYIMYTRASDGDVMISELHRSVGDPDQADANSERVVLRIEHSSASNHNGGTLMFKNGLLYITTGDGGGSPGKRAQRLDLLVGKILRINPHDPDGNGPKHYSVPGNNPFVGRSGLNEIWAYGLRNPWRCSFDDLTAKLWCGDVGQSKYEEVDRARTGRGINFGWPRMEGNHYYNFPNHTSGDTCTGKCYYLPLFEYPHSVDGDDNSNITGGFVSRRAGAAFYGLYLFGDYGSGRIWAVPADSDRGDPLPAAFTDTDMNISSFGQGSDGKLYVVDIGGSVWRIEES